MSTLELKGGLHELISKINDKDRLIKLKKMMLEFIDKSELDEDVIGFDADEKPLTQTKLINQIKTARENVKRGETISHKDFMKQMEKW